MNKPTGKVDEILGKIECPTCSQRLDFVVNDVGITLAEAKAQLWEEIKKIVPKKKELLNNDFDFEEYAHPSGAEKNGFNEAIGTITQRLSELFEEGGK